MASSNGFGSSTTSSGSPCGACKFLRRKCTSECIFAPYFCCEQGPARFAAIHKVFGASNVSKMLLHIPPQDRCDAVVTIAYEAQARIIDPVYGCVSHILALQQQVASLQAQLMQVKAQLNSISPKSSFDLIDYNSCSISDGMSTPDIRSNREGFTFLFQGCSKKNNDLTELQELALRMAGN
ncbi:LOB domain-containing protein 16-like [Vicia villosa]|uniref:LOB domain-containing protein 16-like n=1 Tax=Vicia villosa TaxID=3911 RepID=UPI00273B1070|nr:LOB domain-containing protein 16-like [Vicia villosa]